MPDIQLKAPPKLFDPGPKSPLQSYIEVGLRLHRGHITMFRVSLYEANTLSRYTKEELVGRVVEYCKRVDPSLARKSAWNFYPKMILQVICFVLSEMGETTPEMQEMTAR